MVLGSKKVTVECRQLIKFSVPSMFDFNLNDTGLYPTESSVHIMILYNVKIEKNLLQ